MIAYSRNISTYGLAIGVAIAVGSWPLWTSDWTVADNWQFFFTAILAAISLTAITYSVRRQDLFSPLAFIAGFYILTYAIGGLYYRTYHFADLGNASGALGGFLGRYTTSGLAYGVGLATVGLAFFVFGWALAGGRGLGVAKWCARLPVPSLRQETVLPVGLSLLAIGWAARFAKVAAGGYFHFSEVAQDATTTSASNLIGIAANLPLLAFAVLYASGRLRQRWFWVLLASNIAWAVPSGQRSQLVGVFVMLVVLRYYAREKPIRPWVIGVAAAVCVFVVFPFGAAYRDTGNIQVSPLRALENGYDTMKSRSVSGTMNAGIEETVSRFSGSASLGAIISQGRDGYPGNTGSQVTGLVTAVVPRVLMPDKADPAAGGNEFGRMYGIIAPGQVNTGDIATTQVGDLWGTYGWWGVTIGMLLVGVMIRGFDAYLGPRRGSTVRLSVYATAITGLAMGQESSVAVGVLGPFKEVLVYMVAIAVLVKVIERREGRSLVLRRPDLRQA